MKFDDRVRWAFAGAVAGSIGFFALPGIASDVDAEARARRVLQSPADANELYVAGNFGLLTSADGGTTWDYVCEQAFTGRVPTHTDALALLFDDGSLIAGRRQGRIGVSDDSACNFFHVLPDAAAEAEGSVVVDVAVGDAATGLAYALVNKSVLGDAGFTSEIRLVKSTDKGQSWDAGVVLDELAVASNLLVAPSEPMRIYIAGVDGDNNGVLLASSNGGSSWSTSEVPGASATVPARVEWVDPSNADIVYVSTDDWIADPDEPDNGLLAQDTLLRSSNGGTSFEIWIQENAKITAVTASPDGQTLLVGFGDPEIDANYRTGDDSKGIFAADSGSKSFTRILLDLKITCLNWTADRLYVCTRNFGTRMVSYVEDVNLEGLAWEDLLPLVTTQAEQIRGPLECGCTYDTCVTPWLEEVQTPSAPVPPACSILGICPDGGLPGGDGEKCSDIGTGGAGGTGSGGSSATGGTSSTGGTGTLPDGGVAGSSGSTGTGSGAGGSGTGAGGSGTGSGGTAGDADDSGGTASCNCRMLGGSDGSGVGAALLLVFATLGSWFARRRHESTAPRTQPGQ